jgi:hypothetical protein
MGKYKHGLYGTRFYMIWAHMKERCQNPSNKNYKRYGARGIRLCDEWQDFQGFKEDMFSSYQEGLSIERIDNDGDYSRENCRWATWKEQTNNTRRSRRITYQGNTKTLAQWAEAMKIKRSTLSQRYYVYKWEIEKCLNYGGGKLGK